jgi:hypothetical protein
VSGFSNISATARRAAVWFHGEVFQIDPVGGTNSSVARPARPAAESSSALRRRVRQTRADGWSCRIFFRARQHEHLHRLRWRADRWPRCQRWKATMHSPPARTACGRSWVGPRRRGGFELHRSRRPGFVPVL